MMAFVVFMISATPNAQLTFFTEFLATTGANDAWVNPSKRDVLGTWLLAILAGHNRYYHITGLRGDAVSPQILDINTTIKPMFGKQSGSELSYNAHKPGRPSHTLHTYWVCRVWLVLNVVVSPGEEHSSAKARPGLMGVLEKLTPQQRSALVRGDCAFGNELFITELEDRSQPYLGPATRVGAQSKTHSNSRTGTKRVQSNMMGRRRCI